MDINEIREVFFQECDEQLSELETGLLAINDGNHTLETINSVFRSVHSIKGGAGAFGLDDLVAFAHKFETTLDCVRSNRLTPSQDVIKIMLKSADVLADLISAARRDEDVDHAHIWMLVKDLEVLAKDSPCSDENEFKPIPFSFDGMGIGDEEEIDNREGIETNAIDIPEHVSQRAERNQFLIEFKPNSNLYAKGNDSALLLRDLAALGQMVVHCHSDELPNLENINPETSYLSWTINLTTHHCEDAVRQVFEFAEWDCELDINSLATEQNSASLSVSPAVPATPVGPATPAGPVELVVPQMIRVDFERVDRLINLVGELVINQAMLAQSVGENEAITNGKSNNINTGIDKLNQLSREIQDSVMAIRAQPVKSVFQRMSRIVREIADTVGKNVRLVTQGENTEVDKTVIDKLAEPLTHMIRNSVDHGLESIQERKHMGKDPTGTVKLSAKHRSGRIVIDIEDDGAGINRKLVYQKAIDKGLISSDSKLSDDDIDNLVFHPGFSTADKLSDISGRGVGMDVVKKSIQSLGGRITISSQPGKGTIFSMSLPLTLAVLDGMLVSVAAQTFIIPLTTIIEALQPDKSDIRDFGANQRLISIRKTFWPLVDIGEILDCHDKPSDPSRSVILLVESENGNQCALMVDMIIGQRQVVIKSLELNYLNVPGIAAATILGDGRVALILDVDMIVSASKGQGLVMNEMKSL